MWLTSGAPTIHKLQISGAFESQCTSSSNMRLRGLVPFERGRKKNQTYTRPERNGRKPVLVIPRATHETKNGQATSLPMKQVCFIQEIGNTVFGDTSCRQQRNPPGESRSLNHNPGTEVPSSFPKTKEKKTSGDAHASSPRQVDHDLEISEPPHTHPKFCFIFPPPPTHKFLPCVAYAVRMRLLNFTFVCKPPTPSGITLVH